MINRVIELGKIYKESPVYKSIGRLIVANAKLEIFNERRKSKDIIPCVMFNQLAKYLAAYVTDEEFVFAEGELRCQDGKDVRFVITKIVKIADQDKFDSNKDKFTKSEDELMFGETNFEDDGELTGRRKCYKNDNK